MKQYTRHQLTLSNGETLSYMLTSEDKPKLVLIHGNNSGANHWLDVMEKWEDRYSMLVVDLRGYGESSYLKPIRSLLELAQDVKELLNTLDWEKFSVIGWSLGGGVAMELAAIMPAQVDKLILSASVGVQGFPMYEFDMETFQPMLDKPLTTYEQVENNPIYVLPIEMMKANQDREGLAKTMGALSVKHHPSEEFMNIIVDTLLQQRNLVDADYALMTFNVTNQDTPAAVGSNHLEQIKAPVLILQGNQDLVVLPVMAQITAQFLQDKAKLVTFDEAGHALHTDQWEKWSSEVIEFLEN